MKLVWQAQDEAPLVSCDNIIRIDIGGYVMDQESFSVAET